MVLFAIAADLRSPSRCCTGWCGASRTRSSRSAVTMVAAAASSIHWLARPHLFTLLFLVLFYAALERVREGRTAHCRACRTWRCFPVVTILWTNLHGGFFVGILMICAYGGGELLNFFSRPTAAGRPAAWRSARAYFLSALACLAASLINPYTYHLHVHMVAVSARTPGIRSISSSSCRRVSTSRGRSSSKCCWCWPRSPRPAGALPQGRFTEPVLMLVWAHAGLLAARNIPIFVIVAAPIVAAAIAALADAGCRIERRRLGCGSGREDSTGWRRRPSETEAIGRWHLVSVAGFALVAAVDLRAAPARRSSARSSIPNRYPAAALATLRAGSRRRGSSPTTNGATI